MSNLKFEMRDPTNTKTNYNNNDPIEGKEKSFHKLTRFFKRVVPGAILGGALSVVSVGFIPLASVMFDMLNPKVVKVVSDELDKGRTLKAICKKLWNGCSKKEKVCSVALVINILALYGVGIFTFICTAPISVPAAIIIGVFGAVCGGYISMGGFGNMIGLKPSL